MLRWCDFLHRITHCQFKLRLHTLCLSYILSICTLFIFTLSTGRRVLKQTFWAFFIIFLTTAFYIDINRKALVYIFLRSKNLKILPLKFNPSRPAYAQAEKKKWKHRKEKKCFFLLIALYHLRFQPFQPLIDIGSNRWS